MDSPTERLLAWYDAGRRELPWRDHPDPWAVWVSEAMLQQTRVATVGPYFDRFLARFPSPQALAAAPVEDVLALWSGLGYYRRARQLHAAARAVVEAGGRLPTRAAEWQRLPGVGPYTAAAIASIAFAEAVPALDGNVERVVSRWLAQAEDPSRPAARRRLLAAAAALLDPARPGDTNQALMELGARLCTPRAPACGACPLAPGCAGRAQGAPESFPPPRRRAAVAAVRELAAVVEQAGRWLLVRRPEGAPQLAGLWELPTVAAAGPRAAERALAERYGGRWRLGPQRARVRHTVTRRRIELVARVADWQVDEVAERGDTGWFAAAAAAALPLTGATRKLLARLAA